MARPGTSGNSPDDVLSNSTLNEQNETIAPAGGDPLRDKVAQRAYERYQSRGGAHGYDQDDWLEAEREVSGRDGNNRDGAETAGRPRVDPE
jgi:hypothetical protein